MLARWIRTWDSRLLEPFLAFLAGLGASPAMLTLGGLSFFVCAGLMLACGHMVLGACFILVGGLMDGLDGELARLLRTDPRFGGLLDSLCDHLGDLAAYLGLLSFSFSRRMYVDAFLILLALFGSVFGSHVRSRAGMVGIDCRDIGMFTRCERIVVLALGLLTHLVSPALLVLAIFNNISAAERVTFVMRAALAAQESQGKKGPGGQPRRGGNGPSRRPLSGRKGGVFL